MYLPVLLDFFPYLAMLANCVEQYNRRKKALFCLNLRPCPVATPIPLANQPVCPLQGPTETKMWLLLPNSALGACSSHALSHRHQFLLRRVEPNLVYVYLLGVTRAGKGNNNIKRLNLCIT